MLPTRGEQVFRDALNRLEAYARGMWRFRWRAIIAMWLVSIIGWVTVYLLPPVYEAQARIYVDTENALRPLLRGIASSTNVLNEVMVVTREMLSRPNLAEVARTTDLDLRADTTDDFEDLLTELGENIVVIGSRDNIFTIAYQDPDRAKAVSVVDALVTTFVEKSLGAERTDSIQAQSFLQNQINEYEERLTAAEDRLAAFKRDNVAFMPDQRGGDYFARLQAAKSSVEATRNQLRLAAGRRTELLRQIEGEEPVFGIMPSTQVATGGGYASGKIRQLEIELEELRLQFTDKHPRIMQILDTIEFLKEEQQRELAEASSGSAGSGLDASTPLEMNPVYQNMRIQLSNTEVEIASLRGQLQQQQDEVEELQRAVDTVPQVEAEFGRLNRDYGVVKQKYEQLLAQLETANIGEDVEASIDNVQFRIIDPPFSELEPAGPMRQMLLSGVLVVALGIGAVFAFLLDQVNPVFFAARDVTAATGLPVLGNVSLIMSREDKSDKRLGRLKFTVAVTLLVGCHIAASVSSSFLSPMLRNIVGMDA
jgi:polysaccharide chain length determinant protein (PEP-CTERM system associated)